MLNRLALLLESIKFAHSIFALPFALLAMIIAAGGWPAPKIVALIILCMVSARSAAMAFNRLADRDLDATNPRTMQRASVTGALSPAFHAMFTAVCGGVFILAAYFLNRISFYLALPVLLILLGYSWSKRFTWLCHFWLGFSLGLAPLAAHLAVKGDLLPLAGLGLRWNLSFELFPILLGSMVLLWVAGFDLIYACQDYEVDRQDPRIFSLPKRFGVHAALVVSALLHVLAVTLLIGCGVYAGLGLLYNIAVGIVAVLLTYEHWIVKPADLSRVNMAFFTLNGAVSLLLLAAVFIERVVLSSK